MPRDFFDPAPEQQNVVLVNAATLREAEPLIESCEGCNPDGAEIPFDNILDRVTGSGPSVTDYVMEAPAKCRTASERCRQFFVDGAEEGPAKTGDRLQGGWSTHPGQSALTRLAQVN